MIKSQPEKIYTNIFYIKSILSEADLIGPRGFYVSQMESAADFIVAADHNTFKMSKEEFNRKKEESLKKYNDMSNNENANKEIPKKNLKK